MPRNRVAATYTATVLPYSIGSVLDQTFTDFEVLVVGDGCTDESGDVVTAIDDPRVHWRNLPSNVGHQSGPNNAGIRAASGDVIAYLGHDDLWLPNHLELLVSEIDRGAAIAHGTTLSVHLDRRPEQWPHEDWSYAPGSWMPPTSLAHTRQAVEKVGGWRVARDTGRLAPEADVLQRMAEAFGPPRWVPHFTNVKFPASKRPDVYRTRPCHEQAHWLTRIREAEDVEALVRGARRQPYVYATERSRVGIKVRAGLRRVGALRKRSQATAEERLRRAREFKGVDDGPNSTH